MGILQRITNALAAPFRRGRILDAVTRDQPLAYFQWFFPDQPSGITITSDSALQLSVVWACVTAITNAIASCRWNVYAVEGRKRELLPDDPLDYLLNIRPNSEMTAIALREVLLFGALTWGNGYAEIQRTGAGKVFALWPLMPHRTSPRRDPETGALYYEYQQVNGGIAKIPAKDVFHLKGPGITGLMGDNIVSRAARSMSLFAAQERFAQTYFGNNTIIGGILKHPNKLKPDAHERLREDFEDRYKGSAKSNKPLILEEGMEWQPMSNDADKAQLTASRQYQIEEICRYYNCPPHKVQHLLRATLNNIEHLGIEFARDALTPWAKRLEQEADYKLMSVRSAARQSKLDMAWLLAGDFKSRMEGYQIARRTGIYTINEVREKEGDNHIGAEGDIRIVESNMQTLEQLEMGGPQAFAAAQLPGAGAAQEHDTSGADQNEVIGEGNLTNRSDVVRDSLTTLFASAFDRYERRLKNRHADLQRGRATNAKIATHMAEEREKLRPWALEETSQALALARRVSGKTTDADPELPVLMALDRIDNGQDPRAAAEQLVATLTEVTKC